MKARLESRTRSPFRSWNATLYGIRGSVSEALRASLESGFADRLTDDELTAVAHELGHVWIYTHFPFLQTEQLANEIAMRVVSRESLVPLSAEMFERVRVDGDLSHYLSDTHADH